jgi:putative transposase
VNEELLMKRWRKKINDWQRVKDVLTLFGNKKNEARRRYHEFLIKGIELGRQPELVGGGLIRSAGGWSAIRSLRKAGIFQKSDERILGDGDFVGVVLSEAQESMGNRYLLAACGVSFEDIVRVISGLLSIAPEVIAGASKERVIVKARVLVCYWAVRELGMTMTDVSDRLKISVPTVSIAVRKGMQVVHNEGLQLSNLLNINI